MQLTSSVFENNQSIPPKYSCKGEDVNPPLSISDVPPATQTLVLIVDDPDAPAGLWTHWAVFNIEPTATEIAENSVPHGAYQAINSFKRKEWGGPCPPSGTHRYFFKLFALNIKLDLPDGCSLKQLESAIKEHIIASAELIGLFQKS